MANRRMFSLDVVDTDNFLDMSVSAQCLYFHLGMHADDDGFVSSPKRIMKSAGCNSDDFKILISKGYIILFNSGVVVIIDWKTNNYIQNDRYRETRYKEYKQLLVEDNGKYFLDTTGIQDVSTMDTDYIQSVSIKKLEDTKGILESDGNIEDSEQCIQDVYILDTQDRLGKDSIEIESRKPRSSPESNETLPSPSVHKNDYQSVIDRFNSICVSFPKVTKLSEARKKAIKARLKQYTIEDIEKAFHMAESSHFLKGGNERNWTANFDWMIKDSNIAKILDGNYTDKPSGQKKGNAFSQYPQRAYSKEEVSTLERMLLQGKEGTG